MQIMRGEINKPSVFYCVIARCMWSNLSECLHFQLDGNYESIVGKWISNKKIWCSVNMISIVAMWNLWKVRNLFNLFFRMLLG